MAVLRRRADDASLDLAVVPVAHDIATGATPLGLAAEFQKTNASLAAAVAAAHLAVLGVPLQPPRDHHSSSPPPAPHTALPARFRAGLAATRWPGRCDVRRRAGIAWHLDGGHTLESISLAAHWFASCIRAPPSPPESHPAQDRLRRRRPPRRILVFNQQTRDAGALARALHSALREALAAAAPAGRGSRRDPRGPLFDHAVFCTNVTYAGGKGRYKPDLLSINTSADDVAALSVQRGLAETWERLEAEEMSEAGVGGGAVGTDDAEAVESAGKRERERCTVEVRGTIEEAVERVKELSAAEREGEAAADGAGDECVVLVTGSLHLVGGVLEVLDTMYPEHGDTGAT